MKKHSKQASNKYAKGYRGFLQWVRDVHPAIWDAAQRSPMLSGLGDATDPVVAAASPDAKPAEGVLAKIVDAVKTTGAALLPLYQQQQEFKTQLKRAEAGQAPLDLTNYTGNAGYRVGLTSGTQNTALILGGLVFAGLLGFALLHRPHGKRGR